MSREDVRKQFTEYFRGAEFSAWGNLEPPVILVSPDGKMGRMIVQVRIAYTKTDAGSAASKEDTVKAWMSASEKRDGKWLLAPVPPRPSRNEGCGAFLLCQATSGWAFRSGSIQISTRHFRVYCV